MPKKNTIIPELPTEQGVYINISIEDAEKKGVAKADIDAAVKKIRFADIKNQCGKRIYAVASAETQMNMSGVTGYISSKAVASRTDAEKGHLTAYRLSLEWVNAMRTNVATLAADPDKNIADDANWPEVPAEVVALVAQF